jgi:hypothetical protein
LYEKLVSLAPFAALVVIACGNTYHPEYHPVTTTSLTQTYSNPVVVHNGGAPSERSPVIIEPAPGPMSRASTARKTASRAPVSFVRG